MAVVWADLVLMSLGKLLFSGSMTFTPDLYPSIHPIRTRARVCRTFHESSGNPTLNIFLPAGISEQVPTPDRTAQAVYKATAKSDEHNQTAALATKPAGPSLPAHRTSLPPPPRSMRLDIVITHFHPIRVQPALDFWMDFLESEKVKLLQCPCVRSCVCAGGGGNSVQTMLIEGRVFGMAGY